MTWGEAFAGLWRLHVMIWTIRALRVKLALLRARHWLRGGRRAAR